jgi:hypothetical protein
MNMNHTRNTSWTSAQLAMRWNTHPTSVLRIMKRFGFSGAKFGKAKQAGRRFSDREVRVVEKLIGVNHE